MHSETQTLREGSATHPSAPRVQRQSVSEDLISLADDAKTFRVAVVIGLVMVGGLSLFLPDHKARWTDERLSPVSVHRLDVAEQASTTSAPVQAAPTVMAIEDRLNALADQLHQLLETVRTHRKDMNRALSTLTEQIHAIQTDIVEQRADRPSATPVVGTPPLQTDTMIDRLKSQVGFRGPARQVDAAPLQRSIPWK